MSKLGAPFTYAFLFLAYSRVADFSLPHLHLPFIVGLLAAFFALVNGGVARALTSRIGLLLVAFTIWMVLTTPLSYWKGGSVETLMAWGKSLLVFFMIVGLVESMGQARRTMFVLAISALIVTVMCFLFGIRSHGRLALPFGLLGNPNDLSLILLIGLPFWLLAALNESKIPFRRILAWACIGLILITIAHTGSRMAVVSLAIMGLFVFRNASGANKVKLAVAGSVLVVIAVAIIPESVASRYVTTVTGNPGEDIEADVRAIESATQRRHLFVESVKLTFYHPIFGVGPGQFQAYSAKLAGEEGRRAMWRETHCSFTQVSSETGLIGLFFYAAALLFSLREVNRIYRACRGRRGLNDVAVTAYALMLSLVSFTASAVFASVAYSLFFPTLAGLSVAFRRFAMAEIAARTAASSQFPADPVRAAGRTSPVPV